MLYKDLYIKKFSFLSKPNCKSMAFHSHCTLQKHISGKVCCETFEAGSGVLKSIEYGIVMGLLFMLHTDVYI
jgi:hypothetical protein